MTSAEFYRTTIGKIITEKNEAGGTTVILNDRFNNEKADLKNVDNVKVMATLAVNTADGLYELINNNCDTVNPNITAGAHLEMYLALAGLASEIYLKSIIYNENRHNEELVKEHKLDALFKNLPPSIKAEIEEKYPQIQEKLNDIADVFTIFRYDFERNIIKEDFMFVFEFMEIAKEYSHEYTKHDVRVFRAVGNTIAIDDIAETMQILD